MYCYDLCNYQKVKFMIRLIKLDQIKFMNMGVKIIIGTFENTLRLKCKRTMVSAVPKLLGVVMICQWQHLPGLYSGNCYWLHNRIRIPYICSYSTNGHINYNAEVVQSCHTIQRK